MLKPALLKARFEQASGGVVGFFSFLSLGLPKNQNGRTSSLSSSIQARFKLSLRLANLGFCALSKMMHARLRILSGVEVFRTQQRENIQKTFLPRNFLQQRPRIQFSPRKALSSFLESNQVLLLAIFFKHLHIARNKLPGRVSELRWLLPDRVCMCKCPNFAGCSLTVFVCANDISSCLSSLTLSLSLSQACLFVKETDNS